MTQPNIIGLCGALRAQSFNRKAMQSIANALPTDHRYEEVALNWPLYDGDLEDSAGVPAQVIEAAEKIAQAKAVIIGAPEYNKGITGVLKNALDWLSRAPGRPFANKPTVVISAAAGRTGGETGGFMTRACLIPLGALLVSTPPLLIAGASDAFDGDTLTNERYVKNVQEIATILGDL